MRLESIHLHNVGPFADYKLDLTLLGDARLVAVVGPNGAGKSTLLECAIPGALYRETPTRGSLVSLATARDSYVEARVVNGKAWTIRHSLDCASGKSEALVLSEDGKPALPDTKVTSYDRWAERTFPPPEVLFSSVFSAQAGDGFLGAKPGERKATLLRVLGVERLERLSEQARERARDAKAAAATLAARLEDERARGGDVAALELELTDARTAAEQADAGAEHARQELADAQAAAAGAQAALDAYAAAEREHQARRRRRDELARQVADLELRADGLRAEASAEADVAAELEQLRGRLAQAESAVKVAADAAERARAWLPEARRLAAAKDELEAQQAALRTRIDAARARFEDLEARIRNNEAVLADRATIEAAVAEVARLQAEEQQARQDAAQAEAGAREAAQRGEEALRAVATHGDRARQERARADRLRDALAQAEAIETAARCLPGLQRDVEAAEAQVAAAAADLEALQGRRVAGAEERIGGLRSGLSRVIGAERAAPGARAYSPEQIATETLDADDAAISAATELPTLLAQAAARGCAARERAERARAALREADALAALAGRLEADRVALKQAEAAAVSADEAADAAEHERATAVQQASASRGARDGYLERAQSLAAEVERLRPTAAKAAPLANAEALLAERRPAAEAARAETKDLVAEASELSTRIADAVRPDVAEAELAVAEAESQLTSAGFLRDAGAGAVRAAEERLAAARLAAARLAEFKPQVARGRADLEQLDAELVAVPQQPPAAPDVAAAKTVAYGAESAAREAHQSVAVADQRLEQARAVAGRLVELGAQLSAAELDLADWTRLAADLGRDGLQAALIDAAGPELTELVNDLLHHAHGTRWTVSIETQQLSADGKKMLEGCAVRVLDTERGRDAAAETLSGGERVIVGEAVSLALAMLACRRAGVERPTLVRDESGAALDAMAARAYVAMLRRAAEIVGADRVLLVSHTPEVWEMCDARVELGAA